MVEVERGCALGSGMEFWQTLKILVVLPLGQGVEEVHHPPLPRNHL